MGEESMKRAKEREMHIHSKVDDLDDIDTMNQKQLADYCKQVHSKLTDSEAEKYDLEFEMRKTAIEINALNVQLADSKGIFQKPVLKKVSRTDQKFMKLERKLEKKESIKIDLKHKPQPKNVKVEKEENRKSISEVTEKVEEIDEVAEDEVAEEEVAHEEEQ